MAVTKEIAMKPYSLDLRTRVLADFDAGMTMQSIAEKYRISTKCIRDLRQLREETGQLNPRQGKTGPKAKLSEYLEQLTALVQAQPDATLEELQERLPVRVGLTTIWRALLTLGFTLKKSPACS
jgi:transposase